MKKPQKTKREFDTKAALKPEPFSLVWYIHLCLTDYTFSSLGKRDLRHANSSLGMSCVTSHSLMSNPIDLPRPPHVSRRSSPPLRGFSALLHPHHPPGQHRPAPLRHRGLLGLLWAPQSRAEARGRSVLGEASLSLVLAGYARYFFFHDGKKNVSRLLCENNQSFKTHKFPNYICKENREKKKAACVLWQWKRIVKSAQLGP